MIDFLGENLDYVIVCLEAVFKRGDVLAPVLRVGRLRDEAFGRFWLKFSGEWNLFCSVLVVCKDLSVL